MYHVARRRRGDEQLRAGRDAVARAVLVIPRRRRRAEAGVELLTSVEVLSWSVTTSACVAGTLTVEKLGLAAAGQGPAVRRPQRQVGHRGLLQLEGVGAPLAAVAVGGQDVAAGGGQRDRARVGLEVGESRIAARARSGRTRRRRWTC